jgi:uncharacterized GH25 family protein
LLAVAHECWLELSEYRPAPGAEVTARILVGQFFRGDSMPYLPQWTRRLEVGGPDGRRPAHAETAEDPAVRFQVTAAGGHAVIWESERFTTDIPRLRFEAYLDEAGLYQTVEAWLSQRPELESVREIYYRYPKAIFAAGDATDHVLRSLGARLELVPLRNPMQHRPGESVPVRVLFEGRPLAGALVTGFTREQPERILRARTGRDGIAEVRLDRAGLWLLNVVWILPAGEPAYDWQSFWASLTFEIGP